MKASSSTLNKPTDNSGDLSTTIKWSFFAMLRYSPRQGLTSKLLGKRRLLKVSEITSKATIYLSKAGYQFFEHMQYMVLPE
ncbi:hypothetical protein Hanom_Chr05g00414871 [Helianthus anomalus]